MIYAIDITTSASTLATSPDVNRLAITKGLIYKVEIDFPPGAHGLHYVCIVDNGVQIYPTDPLVKFHSDGNVISFDDTYLKQKPPWELSILTYNDDDTYDHSVQVRVGLVSEEIFMARFLPTYSYKYFKEVLQTLYEQQQAYYADILENPFPRGSGENES